MLAKKVEVCFTPALLPLYDLENATVVIIDIFRATSSICYGLHNGAQAIIPVATVEECLAYQNQNYLLAAERDGQVVEGFDFGNSPFSYTREKIEGKTIESFAYLFNRSTEGLGEIDGGDFMGR